MGSSNHRFNTAPKLKALTASRKSSRSQSTQGFTLIELLVVVILVGILAAIAAPSWLSFLNNQRLNTAQSQVFEVLRRAQTTAKLKGVDYQASFRQLGSKSEWALHPTTLTNSASLPWNNLGEGVQISPETTLVLRSNDLYRVRFNNYGEVKGDLGRVTLSVPNSQAKRCVIVSTLLGGMRAGENRPRQAGNPCD